MVIGFSLSLVACGGGGGDGSSGGNSGGAASDHRIGTYSAEISSSSTVTRSFNILVESDAAVTSGIAEDLPFVQVRDGDNIFSRYRYLRNVNNWPATNQTIQSDYETEVVIYTENSYASLQDCLDNNQGAGQIYKQIYINTPKFSGGGAGTSLRACVLK